MKTTTLLCFLFLSIGFEVHAQSIQQLQRLQEIKNEKEASFTQRKQEAITRAQQLGIPLRQKFSDGRVIELMYFIGNQPMYYITDNTNAALTVSTIDLQPGGSTGYGLSGNGEDLAIWDEGRVRVAHQEFDGRAVISDSSIIDSDHSTHVAGTMIAEGLNANAMGMAFEANILSYDWNGDENEMANEAAAGLFVSNHSYGFLRGWIWNGASWTWWGNPSISNTQDYLFGFYDATAQGWDEIANNAPYYLICKSAGNDRGDGPSGLTQEIDGGANGYDCIPQNAVAKNILTIGAVNDISAGYSTPADVVMSNFSGWGPADDGRIKPDLVANGVDLFSPVATNSSGYPSNNSYDTYSGTSMATPNVSGSIGLLLEHQRNNYNDVVLRSSTMKALLIHSADEAGADPGPDYMFGWGLANFRRAAELIEESANHCINISEYILSQNEIIEIPVVKRTGQNFKVTICWNDPAGIPQPPSLNPTNRMLINDLDLRVIGGSTTFFPWVLDRNNPSNAATRADNTVDNVEQVIVDGNYSGIYTIRISHKGNLQNNSQIVSVIISGNETLNTNENVDYLSIYNGAFWAHENLSSTYVTINSGADVTFISGNTINLNSGFLVKSGAFFSAKIVESLNCNSGTFGLKSTNLPIPSSFIYDRNIISRSENANHLPNSNFENKQLETKKYEIFPNPSNGLFNLEFYGNLPKSIEIIDLSGKVVYSKYYSIQNNMQLDLTENNRGLLILKLIFENEVITKKLILD